MFVTVEGIDGSGKSTLAKALAEALRVRLGADRVVLTHEPTDQSPWGRRLRQSFADERLSREDEIEHFHQDRLHHLTSVIEPALAKRQVVICDRYVDSLLAYQARDPADADTLYTRMAAEILEPDLVLILQLPVEAAIERIGANRTELTSFERDETLKRAAAIYASRKGARYHRIDARLAPDQVLKQAVSAVLSAMKA